MVEWLTPDRIGAQLVPGEEVYLAGGAGEPAAILDSWAASPPPPGLRFTLTPVPGVNTRDPTTLAPESRARTVFMTPELRAGFVAGRVDYLPFHYSQTFAFLGGPAGIAAALVQLAPPDARGNCSFGVACDLAPALLATGARLYAQINPAMPATDGPSVPLERLAAAANAEAPLPVYDPGAPGEALRAAAAHAAAFVRDGDTIQLGVGRLQSAMAEALRGKRGLSVHSGMISDGLMQLAQAGVVTGSITAGMALGSAALYRWIAAGAPVHFAPASETHAAAVLAGIENFVAINGALEADLLGQTNAEARGLQQIGGHGGLVDFQRGARASPGGRSIVVLTATGGRDAVSRIVPRLPHGGPVSTLRADAGVLVTEFGAADLRDMDVDTRARAIVALAHPAHRDALMQEWLAIRQQL